MKISTAGKYDVQLVPPTTPEQWFTVSDSGKDGIVLDFKTADGQTIQTTLWLSPSAYERSLKVLDEVFGFDGDFNALAKGRPFPGLKCIIVCEEEDYKGRPQIRVKWINPRGGKRAAVNLPEMLARIQRLKGEDHKPQPSSTELAEDDIPY